jgi:hypothetical protein
MALDCGPEETSTTNCTKLISIGPNKEMDMKGFQENILNDKYASKNEINEFSI